MKSLMTILKKRELLKHQKSSGGFLPQLSLVVLVCSLVFLPSYSSKAEEVTSGQLLQNRGFEANTNTTSPSNWTKNGDAYVCNTCGPYGGNALKTGNESSDPQGGIVSQTVDLFNEMNQEQINHGFDLNYRSQVYSHSSNATVPACNATEGDCRDTFEINLTVTDSNGTILNTFSHRYEEITWTGWDTSTFNFTSTVPENEYTSAFATFSLFGVDSGVATNNQYGGPRFDNVSLTATYTTQATLDIIAAAVDEAMEVVNQQIDAATDIATEPQTINITINDPVGNEIETFSVEIESTPEVNVSTIEAAIEMAPVEMEVPSFDTPVSTGPSEVEAQVEVASIEMEMNNDIGQSMDTESTEPQGETTTEAEPEPQTSEPEQQEASSESESSESESTSSESSETNEPSSNEDSSNEPEAAESEQESKSEVRSGNKQKSGGNKSKSKSVKQIKRQAKQKVANKIVKNMGDKGRYDSTNQMRTLVVMGVLGNTRSFFSAQKLIPDIPNFFTSDRIPDSAIADNTGAAYYMIGGSDVAHRALVDSQYK